jgi:hypothetical protein
VRRRITAVRTGIKRIHATRDAAGQTFTLYDARHTFVSTLMAAGVPLPEVAAYSGRSVGELGAVAAGDGRFQMQVPPLSVGVVPRAMRTSTPGP